MRLFQRMCSAAILRGRRRSLLSSRSMTLPPWRCVLLCWPATRQTRRSDARYRSCKDHDGPAPEFRAQKLLSARSLSIAFSSSASARSFHSFGEAFG